MDKALRKLFTSSSQVTKKPNRLPSSQKRDLARKYSPAESILPITSSSLLSNGRSLYSHLSPNKSQLKSAPCELLPSQNGDVQQEHVQQETQFTNIPSSIPPCQERGYKKSQGTNTQSREKGGLYRPVTPKPCELLPSQNGDLQQEHAQQETQLMNISPSIPPYQQLGHKKSHGLNTQFREKGGLYRPTTPKPYGLLPRQNGYLQQENAQQETQLMNISPSIPPYQQLGHKKSHGSNTQFREKGGLNRPTTLKPYGLLPRQNDDLQQENAQQETQLKNISPSIPPYQQLGHRKSHGSNTQFREKGGLYRSIAPKRSQLPQTHTDVLYRQTPQESQLSKKLSAPLFHPYKRNTLRDSQLTNGEHQESQLNNTPINLQSRNEHSLNKNRSSQLSQLWNTRQYEERSSQESRLTSTSSSLLSRPQELSLRNVSTNVLCTSSWSSTHDRPNSDIIEHSSQNVSGRRVPLQTGSSNLSTGYKQQKKILQMPGPSKELSSKESRSLMVQKIATETVEQSYRPNTAPSKLLLRRTPFPLKSYQKMDLPVTTVHLMESRSNSHANTPDKIIQHMANMHKGSSGTPLPEQSNIDKNSEGKKRTRLNSSQGIRNIQPFIHIDHGIRPYQTWYSRSSAAEPEV